MRVGAAAPAREGFPEFIPSTSRVSARRHLIDESPALTAVLQAQRAAIVAAPRCSEAKQRAAGVAVGAATVRERLVDRDRKSTRLNSSHLKLSRMPSSA